MAVLENILCFFSFSWTGGMTINSKIKAVGGSCSRSTVNLR
jgi:hypothetical protein